MSPRDGDNVGRSHILRRQSQRIANFRQQGGNGKPNEKGNKERPPRVVKGPHVGSGKTAQFQFRRLVVIVDGQTEFAMVEIIIIIIVVVQGHIFRNVRHGCDWLFGRTGTGSGCGIIQRDGVSLHGLLFIRIIGWSFV